MPSTRKACPARRPPRLLRGRRPGGHHGREGAGDLRRRRSTCASRSCTTSTSSRPCRTAARSSSRRTTRCPRARPSSSPRTASRRSCTSRRRARQLKTIDATCPLVTKVHHEARRFAADDYDILLIGHEGHEEVVGTTGEAPDHIHLVDGPDDVDQRRRCATRRRSPGSRRPRCRSTRRWRRCVGCASGSPRCSTRRATTSATPRRTARSR